MYINTNLLVEHVLCVNITIAYRLLIAKAFIYILIYLNSVLKLYPCVRYRQLNSVSRLCPCVRYRQLNSVSRLCPCVRYRQLNSVLKLCPCLRYRQLNSVLKLCPCLRYRQLKSVLFPYIYPNNYNRTIIFNGLFLKEF